MRILRNVATVAMQGEPPAEEHLCDLSSVRVLEARPFVSAAALSSLRCIRRRPLTDSIDNCRCFKAELAYPKLVHNTGYEAAQEY